MQELYALAADLAEGKLTGRDESPYRIIWWDRQKYKVIDAFLGDGCTRGALQGVAAWALLTFAETLVLDRNTVIFTSRDDEHVRLHFSVLPRQEDK